MTWALITVPSVVVWLVGWYHAAFPLARFGYRSDLAERRRNGCTSTPPSAQWHQKHIYQNAVSGTVLGVIWPLVLLFIALDTPRRRCIKDLDNRFKRQPNRPDLRSVDVYGNDYSPPGMVRR